MTCVALTFYQQNTNDHETSWGVFHMNKYLAFQNEIVYFKEINKY